MYAGGNLLEDIAIARAERDLRSLVDRAPHIAHRRTGETIADIASYHHEGNAHLPKRQVIVDVPTGSECEDLMRKEGELMVAAVYKEAAG